MSRFCKTVKGFNGEPVIIPGCWQMAQSDREPGTPCLCRAALTGNLEHRLDRIFAELRPGSKGLAAKVRKIEAVLFGDTEPAP